jgi:pimeloyl-ACP methyl ester carboxylesterase
MDMTTWTTAAEITTGGVRLDADLIIPADPDGVVLFSHGSGSSRTSPRNRAVAEVLNERHLTTVLVDLLTPGEEEDRSAAELRFDIGRLADRLVGIVDWLGTNDGTRGLPIGLFGASTGAAAALVAAAARPEAVWAVVSRGGRPDLAGPALVDVKAPTLFIVGEHDEQVLELNHQAHATMTALAEVRIIPGAGHLFEEPGTLEAAAAEAATWFADHLAGPPEPAIEDPIAPAPGAQSPDPALGQV